MGTTICGSLAPDPVAAPNVATTKGRYLNATRSDIFGNYSATGAAGMKGFPSKAS